MAELRVERTLRVEAYPSSRGNLLHYGGTNQEGIAFAAGSGTPIAMAIGFSTLWVSEFDPDELVRVRADATNRVLATIQLPFDPAPGGLANGYGVWVTNGFESRQLQSEEN